VTGFFERFRRGHSETEAEAPAARTVVEIDASTLSHGATLELNPLVVLIVTIGFGAIFGMVGMILAAPLTSAAVHISRELAAAKAREAAEHPDRAPPAEPTPAVSL
jgi:AI-2E family transporter